MKRTTIMLPADLRTRALQHAHRLGISLGELIRQCLKAKLHSRWQQAEEDPLFTDDSVFRGNAPKDGARKHDRYLYAFPLFSRVRIS